MNKYFLSFLGTIVIVSLFAQTPSKVLDAEETFGNQNFITNVFRGNSYISVAGGGQIYFGEKDCEAKFDNRLSPALSISAGKWFSPFYGAAFSYNGGSFKSFSDIETEYSVWDDGLYRNKMKTGYFHLDFLLNVTNGLHGYSDERCYDLIAYIGAGRMQKWNKPLAGDFAANIGVINSLSLTRKVDLRLDVMYGVVRGSFNGVMRKKLDSFVSANIGLAYRFGNRRGWMSVSQMDPYKTNRLVAELDSMNNKINEMRRLIIFERENSVLLVREIKDINEKVQLARESVCKNPDIVPYALFFNKDESELTNSERVSLDYFAGLISRSPKSVKFVISSVVEKNEQGREVCYLRAKNVRDILVNEYSIDAECLTLEEVDALDDEPANIVLIKKK